MYYVPITLHHEVPDDLHFIVLHHVWVMLVPLLARLDSILLAYPPMQIYADFVVSSFILFLGKRTTCTDNVSDCFQLVSTEPAFIRAILTIQVLADSICIKSLLLCSKYEILSLLF